MICDFVTQNPNIFGILDRIWTNIIGFRIEYYRNFTFVADIGENFQRLRVGIGAIQDMLGTAEDEISSNP